MALFSARLLKAQPTPVAAPAPAPSAAPVAVGTVGSYRAYKKDLRVILAPAPKADKPAPKPEPKPEPKPKKPKPKPGKGPLLLRGAKGAPVRRLEKRLTELGYDVGKPNNFFGDVTVKAVKRFQKKHDLERDGVVGKKTWRPLGIQVEGKVNYPGPDYGKIRKKLRANLNNPYKGATNQCFKYAWSTVTRAGGHSIGGSTILSTGRWKGTAHIGTLVKQGKIKVGDIIYVNRKPQADPTSTNLAYGPHWFVYIGKGQFADQYGVRGAQAMANFVPGRYIDQIYRAFK